MRTKINSCTNPLQTVKTEQPLDMKFAPAPPVISRMLPSKLNLNSDSLLAKYSIIYSNKHVGKEKHIILRLKPTDMYDKSDVLDIVEDSHPISKIPYISHKSYNFPHSLFDGSYMSAGHKSFP